MFVKTFLAFFSAATAIFSAQGSDAWIGRMRPGHPRMFFNVETWPRIKAYAEGKGRPHLDHLIKTANAYPTNPVCSGTEAVVFREVKTRTGTHKTARGTPIKAVKEWGVQAATCALAWRFTGDPAYLEKAKKMLIVSAAAYREAYRNGRAVSWYASSRIMAFCAYDWIWEALTPAERRAIIVPLVEHVEEAHPQRGKKGIIRRNMSSWRTGYYGVRSLMWYSGLAAYGDGFCDALARRHLVEGAGEFHSLLAYRAKSAGDDGGLVSAVPGYCLGQYPFTHFNFLHTWRSAFDENLAARYPAMALFPNWIFWTWIATPDGARHAGFGDEQHTQNFLPVRALPEHMTQYIHFFKDVDPTAARLAATLRGRVPNTHYARTVFPVYPFLCDPETEGVTPYEDAFRTSETGHARHFETLGQFLMRSGWDENATFCSFTAGASFRQHKHHDENSFVIYKHDFLALDSGSRGYETDHNLKYYYAQTVAHNGILVHAPDEPLPAYWGLSSDAPEGRGNYGGSDTDIPAKVKAFETNGDFTYIASDATGSYGKKCRTCIRQFVHLLPDVFVVYDRVTAADPSFRKEWLLHTKDEPVIEGVLMRADSGKGRLFCQTLLPADARLEKVGGPGWEFWSNGRNWELDERFVKNAAKEAAKYGRGPYYGSWRLEVKPGAARAEDRFLHVLTAADTSTATPVRAERTACGDMDAVALVLPEVVRDGKTGSLRAVFGFRRDGSPGGVVKLFFKEKGRAAETCVLNRPLVETVTPQSGIFRE